MCCAEEVLCDRCYGRELASRRPQARVIGACWAERVCRGELRRRAAWPAHEGKALEIARRLVSSLAKDARLRELLAAACSSGAAAWWERRPMRYRISDEPVLG
jgi:hypothetical protein